MATPGATEPDEPEFEEFKETLQHQKIIEMESCVIEFLEKHILDRREEGEEEQDSTLLVEYLLSEMQTHIAELNSLDDTFEVKGASICTMLDQLSKQPFKGQGADETSSLQESLVELLSAYSAETISEEHIQLEVHARFDKLFDFLEKFLIVEVDTENGSGGGVDEKPPAAAAAASPEPNANHETPTEKSDAADKLSKDMHDLNLS